MSSPSASSSSLSVSSSPRKMRLSETFPQSAKALQRYVRYLSEEAFLVEKNKKNPIIIVLVLFKMLFPSSVSSGAGQSGTPRPTARGAARSSRGPAGTSPTFDCKPGLASFTLFSSYLKTGQERRKNDKDWTRENRHHSAVLQTCKHIFNFQSCLPLSQPPKKEAEKTKYGNAYKAYDSNWYSEEPPSIYCFCY